MILNNRRCVCCNKVSSQDIETDLGDFSTDYFVVDPTDQNSFICHECSEWHTDLMTDYEKRDDALNWIDEDFDNFELTLDVEPSNDNEPPPPKDD